MTIRGKILLMGIAIAVTFFLFMGMNYLVEKHIKNVYSSEQNNVARIESMVNFSDQWLKFHSRNMISIQKGEENVAALVTPQAYPGAPEELQQLLVRYEEALKAVSRSKSLNERIQFMENLTSLSEIISSQVNKDIRDIILLNGRRAEELIAYMGRYSNILILLGILVVVGVVGYAVFLGKHISDNLGLLKKYSVEIAEGKLDISIPTLKSRDEVNELLNSYANMSQKLRKQIQELKDGISVLASSITEIVSSVAQLSSSGTEINAAISESISTIEEVKQTSALVQQKAEVISQSAKEAAEVAQEGDESVNRTIQAIHEIKSKMEDLGNSIVKLSDHSQTISNIINVVKDIAEQSNLLAVNASIEAAKAGEYGKGFSVVAKEIRSLAEQSRKATEEIREIIQQIQKDTGNAVMIAEQGMKSVNKGVEQANESGESIKALAETVEEAAQSMMQISISTKEQYVGVDQMTTAVEDIKISMENNIEGIKQIEESLDDLKELSDKIKLIVETYRV